MRSIALAALFNAASITNALYFSISSLTANDIFQPVESHNITFTVSDPTAVFEQGGSGAADCAVAWMACDIPSCWKKCSANAYYTRITSETYKGADNFSLDIWQEFVYELANHNNATISITEEGAYTCTRDERSTVCMLENMQSVNRTLQTYYGGASPPGAIC
ncbi:hypothetical protein AMS68_002120 [Peltaster fructicola]|uniref:Ig-like domain-containing protein n=1 Tax=Peltaster fructicola TaxID=286661 RepID=A0A6H0XPF9_9PEZI|nr:hypothetical protein AMS68_002120 [Peltaster fructicola]